MKKAVSSFCVFLSIFFISTGLFAGVTPLQGSASGKASQNYTQEDKKPCQLRGYNKTSCSVGEVLQNPCPDNDKYFSTCACDMEYYKYSTYNCEADKKELSGKTCVSGDVTLYKNCSCKSAFKVCKQGAFSSAVSCEDESGTKYNICNEDIPTCESIGHLSKQPAGYTCQEIKNEYMFCYISSSCQKI